MFFSPDGSCWRNKLRYVESSHTQVGVSAHTERNTTEASVCCFCFHHLCCCVRLGSLSDVVEVKYDEYPWFSPSRQRAKKAVVNKLYGDVAFSSDSTLCWILWTCWSVKLYVLQQIDLICVHRCGPQRWGAGDFHSVLPANSIQPGNTVIFPTNGALISEKKSDVNNCNQQWCSAQITFPFCSLDESQLPDLVSRWSSHWGAFVLKISRPSPVSFLLSLLFLYSQCS